MISKCITEEWKRIFIKGTPKMSMYPVPLRIDRQNYHLCYEEARY